MGAGERPRSDAHAPLRAGRLRGDPLPQAPRRAKRDFSTAAEVTPVRELDDRQVGKGSRGPFTERVQDAYCDAVRGVRVPDEGWLTIV